MIDDLEVAAPTAARPGRDHTWLASRYPVRHDEAIVAVGVFVTDITDRVRAERGLQLLFDVGEALDATLGVEERLARLAALVVPTLADFCTIEMIDASGTPRTVAGEPLPDEGPGDPERLVVAPLRARGRDLGRLALRTGIPEIEAAARYSPMGDGVEVGGDFYDLFAAGPSWVAVAAASAGHPLPLVVRSVGGWRRWASPGRSSARSPRRGPTTRRPASPRATCWPTTAGRSATIWPCSC